MRSLAPRLQEKRGREREVGERKKAGTLPTKTGAKKASRVAFGRCSEVLPQDMGEGDLHVAMRWHHNFHRKKKSKTKNAINLCKTCLLCGQRTYIPHSPAALVFTASYSIT